MMVNITRDLKIKDNRFMKFLWSYEARTEGCKAQHWHEDCDTGYSIVMPLYPAYWERNDTCSYSMSVIRGSHNNSIYNYGDAKKNSVQGDCVEHQAHIDNMLHLEIKVGQTLIFHSNLIHRGGASSRCDDMYFTKNSEDTSKIGAFKNLAIHGYLRYTEDEEFHMDVSPTPKFRDIILL